MDTHQNSARLDVIRVTRYTTSFYVIHFICALNFGEAQESRKLRCFNSFEILDHTGSMVQKCQRSVRRKGVQSEPAAPGVHFPDCCGPYRQARRENRIVPGKCVGFSCRPSHVFQ